MMLASKLALTVLLVALGSVLANAADSEVAERRDDDERDSVIELVFINKLKKEICSAYVVKKRSYKVKLVTSAKAGEISKGKVDVETDSLLIFICEGKYNSVRDTRISKAASVAGDRKNVLEIVFEDYGKEGAVARTRVEFFSKKGRYDEKEGRCDVERGY